MLLLRLSKTRDSEDDKITRNVDDQGTKLGQKTQLQTGDVTDICCGDHLLGILVHCLQLWLGWILVGDTVFLAPIRRVESC